MNQSKTMIKQINNVMNLNNINDKKEKPAN
jgi:hypothetical protein